MKIIHLISNRVFFVVAMTVLCSFIYVVNADAKKWKANEVIQIINKVNNYWQTNNPAEVNAFWDNAAYHTGNMEVYKLLHDDAMLE